MIGAVWCDSMLYGMGNTLKIDSARIALCLICIYGTQVAPVSAQDLQPEEGEAGSVRTHIQGGSNGQYYNYTKRKYSDLELLDDSRTDHREEMRRFVERAAQFSHRFRPAFGVIVEDALALLVKINPVDTSIIRLARAYTKSIDGIMPTGLFHGMTSYGIANDDPDVLEMNLDLAAQAKKVGLPVFVLDKTDDPKQIAAGRDRSANLGYRYGVSTSAYFEDGVLPDFPDKPYDENATNILSLKDVRNFAVIGNSALYGPEDEFALRMNLNNYDLLVVDVFHGQKPLSKRAVETLQYKRNGARRLVYARVNIGTAARYLYYWRDSWREGSPRWLGRPMLDNPDAHYVEYWRPEWQRIIYGDTASYIYGVIDQGYDGVVLADVDAFQEFEDYFELR